MSDEKCPRCGAGSEAACFEDEWDCGSLIMDPGARFKQSDECRIRELTAKLAAAEAELGKAAEAFMRYANGDIVIRWNPDGFYGYGRGIQGNACGPHASAFDAALAALAALPQEQA